MTTTTVAPLVQPSYPIQTQRLTLRPVTLADVPSIHAYRSIPEVAEYLPHEPHSLEATTATITSMVEQGILVEPGSWLDLAVEVTGTPGVIGEVLLKWDAVEPRNGEVGFVFHPSVHGSGIASEAVVAALNIAFESFGWHRVEGVCDIHNVKSAGLMRRLGMRKEAELRDVKWQKGRWITLCHYAIRSDDWHASQEGPAVTGSIEAHAAIEQHDLRQLDDITREFFNAFRSSATEPERFTALAVMFTPDAVITKIADGVAQRMSVAEFIAPRKELLTNGRLQGFTEWEDSATTNVFGDIASRWLHYSKNGTFDGASYGGSGLKSIQFLRIDGAWLISSVLWEDERS